MRLGVFLLLELLTLRADLGTAPEKTGSEYQKANLAEDPGCG